MKILDFIIYWSIVLIPFFMGVAPAPMNVFMGFLIAAYLAKKIIKKEPVFFKLGINRALFMFFAVTCISLVNSINMGDSLKGGVFRLLQYLIVLFAVAGEVKDKKHFRLIVGSLILGAVFVSSDGFFQVFTGKDLVRGYSPVINLGMVRATGPFKDSNLMGIYLSAIAPLCFGLALYFYKFKKKVLFLLASALVLAGIFLTYSRPTLLAIYIILLVFGIARKSKGMIILLVAAALLSPFIVPKSVKEFAKAVEYNPLRFMCNDDRIAIYMNGYNMIKHHPLIGVGANTFMKNYARYKLDPEYRDVVTTDFAYAHDNFIQIAAELGFTGLIIFLWLIYQLFIEAIKIQKAQKDAYLKIAGLSLILCLAAFLINGLTESSFYYARVALIFWYLAGLLFALRKPDLI